MSAATHLLPEYFDDQRLHQGARLACPDPITIETPAVQWGYAWSLALHPALADERGFVAKNGRFIFDITVTRGVIGAGWTNAEGTAFLDERFSSGRDNRMTFRLVRGERVGRLIFRNAGPGPSEFAIAGAHFRDDEGAVRYPVDIQPRNASGETSPLGGATHETFDTDAAHAINAARLHWLETAGLPLHGGRVLDVGAGVGHFSRFYRSRGCTVVAIDGRRDNIEELRRRHPDVEGHVADVQEIDPTAFGTFDVIHCFGLLYHLDSPVAALRRFQAMCRGLLIIETMTCDSSRPVAVLADETMAASQAMQGLGSRPSPAFITLALNRVGFRCIYGASVPPRHPDFQFEWRDDLSTSRDGVPLRCVMVASQSVLDLPSLMPLLES